MIADAEAEAIAAAAAAITAFHAFPRTRGDKPGGFMYGCWILNYSPHQRG